MRVSSGGGQWCAISAQFYALFALTQSLPSSTSIWMRVNLGNRCPISQGWFCCQKNAENTSCRYLAFSHNLACVHNICIQTDIIVCWPKYFFMGGGTLKGVRKNNFLDLTHICLKRNLTIVRKSLELKKISPVTSLKSMMDAKLSKQRLRPCFEVRLMK